MREDTLILVPFQCDGCGHYVLTTLENGKVTCLWCKKEYMIV